MAKTGIYFYKSSIEKCLRQIDKAKVRYENRINELLDRLGELGSATAFNEYHKFQLNPDMGESHSIRVTYAFVDKNVIEIRGNGKGICFLEFGAGSEADSSHPFAENVPFEVRKGSWSDTHSGMYANTGYNYWYFGGRLYKFVEKRAGMYEAYKIITQRVFDIAKEVLG